MSTAPWKPAPIAAQIADLERRLTAETDPEAFDRLRSAIASLRLIERHADGLRALISWLRRQQQAAAAVAWEQGPGPAEAAALLAAPGVQAVLEAFPGAVIVAATDPVRVPAAAEGAAP